MNGATERRKIACVTIEHGLLLKRTYGIAFAAAYLSGQGVGKETIKRVLYGHWRGCRVVDCLFPSTPKT